MIVAYWVRGSDYRAMADMSAETVKRVHPEADIRIVTDDVKRPAMIANLDAQLKVLWSASPGEPVLFLDCDTLMRKPFPFGTEDLYVTWRDHVGYSQGEKVAGIAELMAYNYGVLGMLASERTYEALLWMRAYIHRMSTQHQGWYGNQLALSALVGARPNEGERTISTRIRWSLTDEGTEIKVRQLPCETFNYSPEREGEDVSAKVIIHLKGARKDLMQHYARCA